jgi:Na+-driven multidrug efflux pump
VTERYLRIVAMSYGFLGIVNLTAAAFNGLKKPLYAAGVAALRLFALLIPLAYVGRLLFDLPGIFWGVAVGNVLAGLAAFMIFVWNRKRTALQLETPTAAGGTSVPDTESAQNQADEAPAAG